MSRESPDRPRVTVVLPVCDGERYLAEALESVLAQSYRDFECLVIDDGSRDGTWSILADFEAKDPRVRVVSRENRGLIDTLNEALDLARGEILVRMDADDVALSGRIEAQVAYLDANPDCVAVGCRATMVDPDGWPITAIWNETTHEELDEKLRRGRCSVPHPGSAFRRDLAREVGGYRKEFPAAEDVDFFLRLGEHGRLANLPEVFLLYRVHPGSESRTKAELQERSARAAVEAACRRRGIEAPAWPAAARKDYNRSAAEQHRRWALWALKGGHLRTARKHAWRSIRRSPFRPVAWRTLRWALRGHA